MKVMLKREGEEDDDEEDDSKEPYFLVVAGDDSGRWEETSALIQIGVSGSSSLNENHR